MMDALAAKPKYEAYKESGVDWLGTVPKEWEITRLKFLSRINPPQKIDRKQLDAEACFLPMDAVHANGKVRYDILKPIKELRHGFTGFKRNDVIVAKITPCFENGKGAFLDSMPTEYGFGSTEFHVIRSGTEITPKFIFYLTKTAIFMKLGEQLMTGSAGQKRVQTSFVENFLFALPPITTQHNITQFLDQKIAQIEAAIAIKEKQIARLKERKQIIIQKAVTQGLNPDVPMKDSDVDWIGEIPEHWEVRRSKFLFNQRKERAWKNDVQLSATQKYGVIPQEQYEALSGSTVVKIQFHLDKRKHVERDDFVISMRSFQGGLERAWSQGCIRSSYIILKPLEEVSPDFYGYLFKLPNYIKALQRTASFIRDGQDLNFNNYSQVDLFIPPLKEQVEIANYIKGFMDSTDEGVGLLETQINKLKEYKTTLTNSAVTGKIKVA